MRLSDVGQPYGFNEFGNAGEPGAKIGGKRRKFLIYRAV
jgi:hypothetical protein